MRASTESSVLLAVRIVFAGLLLTRTLPLCAVQDNGTASFVVHVTAGQSFSRELPNGLYFCLREETLSSGGTLGWAAFISPKCASPMENYADIVTLPLRGPNPLDILAWHFEPGENAPQEFRRFRFVLTKE